MRQPFRCMGLALVMAAGFTVSGGPGPASADADVTISGVVYRDVDNDGSQDLGEPGISGLKVYSGRNSTKNSVTDANGSYTLALPSTWPTSNIFVGTAWFRSLCDALYCGQSSALGEWVVDNQRVRMKVDPSQGNLTGKDVGLVPDWPGAVGPIPAPPTANAVDIAVRLSGTSTAGCDAGGALNICEVDPLDPATPGYSVQILNQGTVDLTGIKVGLSVPSGDCLVSAVLDSGASPVGLTLSTTPSSYTCSTRSVSVAVNGTLKAGAQAIVALGSIVNAGPGTTGCGDTPEASCSDVEPQGRSWQVGISAIDQGPDADSPLLCTVLAAFCGTGIHDKRYEPDHVDVAGHNVRFALGDTTAFNLKMDTYLARPAPAGGVDPGDTVVFRTHVVNNVGAATTTNQAFKGWTVRTYFPAGTTFSGTPVNNSIVGCTYFPGAQSPYTQCVGKGPVASYVASVAVDIAVTIPSSWPSGTKFTAVSCATPAAGQPGETVPAATCHATTQPGTTSTDNDDAKSVAVS